MIGTVRISHLQRVEMSVFVRWIHEVDGSCIHEVGGKGAHLGELIQAGFHVPEGFSILAKAYDRFFQANHLDQTAHEVLEPLELSDLSGLEERARRFQEAFVQAPMPQDLALDIREAYRDLCLSIGESSARVAVRSSVATVDLTRTSFPGQMDTYHNVVGEDQVLLCVKKCWASLWNFGALVQRLSLRIDPYGVVIAPVVQRMVPAETAGVLFTANPLDPEAGQIVINACLGLGEGVVSGRFAVDHFVIQRDGPCLLEQDIGVKESKIVISEGSSQGTEVIQVGDQEARAPCLSWDQIVELVALGEEVEHRFGRPQDVEWAFANNTFYLLQTRSIQGTAKRPLPPSIPSQPEEWVSEFDTPIDACYPLYTAANISEVLPGVLTPLTHTGLDMLEYGFQAANLALGIISKKDLEGRRFFFLGSFYGRAFLNLSAVREITARVPGGTGAEIDRDTPPEYRRPPQRGAPRATLTYVIFVSRVMRNSWNRMHQVPLEVQLYRSRVEERIQDYRSRKDRGTWPWKEYIRLLTSAREEGYEAMRVHIEVSQFAVVLYEMLRKVTTMWLDDHLGTLTARLVTGLATVESARPVFEIWELSRMVKQSPELKELFETHDPGEIHERLGADHSEETSPFKEALAAFLSRHGYRSVFEAEVMLPSWEQDPTFIFAMIKNYLNQSGDHSPQHILARQENERDQAVRKTLARLPVLKRQIFQWLLKEAQRFITLRESMKATLMMGVGQSKILFREISRRFHEQGIIKEPDDFYFFIEREILDIMEGKTLDGSIQERLAKRRQEYERNKQVLLPEYFEGRPKPIARKGPSGEQEGLRVLKGIPLSPGKVRGRARVICDPRSSATIEPGEILVAPVTDAGWTPLFLTAAGIVVDIGGLLSHGSIVAREYGIPGVINVKIATEVIKNGQEIVVDGDRGEVHIL